MEEVKFFEVTVKYESFTGKVNKAGNDVMKKSSYTYLVEAGSPQDASDIVAEEWKDDTSEWRIASVKESKIKEAILK